MAPSQSLSELWDVSVKSQGMEYKDESAFPDLSLLGFLESIVLTLQTQSLSFPISLRGLPTGLQKSVNYLLSKFVANSMAIVQANTFQAFHLFQVVNIRVI